MNSENGMRDESDFILQWDEMRLAIRSAYSSSRRPRSVAISEEFFLLACKYHKLLLPGCKDFHLHIAGLRCIVDQQTNHYWRICQ